MKQIEVTVRELDKGKNDLTLLNVRDELVNVLYKETVANSTKADQQFYVLLFFVLYNNKNKVTFLETLLDEALPKFNLLNKAFQEKKGRLQTGQYAEMIKEYELSDIFQYDVFFILTEAILNLPEIRKRYANYISKNESLNAIFDRIETKYTQQVASAFNLFESSEIEDERYDDQGNFHDLSKSVYRTIRMRNARNLDLHLQKYTSIKSVTSRSPIDFTFLQHVDIQILFDLWTKYHLPEYTQLVAKETFDTIKNHVDFNINLGDVFNAWLIYHLLPAREKKNKKEALSVFKELKKQEKNQTALTELTQTLVHSVMNANERLIAQVEEYKKELQEVRSGHIASQDKVKIEKLEERISKLENITVTTKEVYDEDDTK